MSRFYVVSKNQDARKGETVQYQTGGWHAIPQRHSSQPWMMLVCDKKRSCREQAKCQKNAEPVHELSRVCAQMRINLLVFVDQQTAFSARHVAESWRTMFMAQHKPTATP